MILAFDTSNYTTSVALIGKGGTVKCDCRRMLTVKKGERGLRQSEALFQHGKNLPELIREAAEQALEGKKRRELAGSIDAIAVSTKPRRIDGSYMPCFLAGLETAQELATVLGVPLYEFSHQEGHMAAASFGTILEQENRYLAWHLSGGTCELLKWEWDGTGKILGGTLDISFGQVLDRMGVALSLPFPCGKAIDEAALRYAATLRPGARRKNGLTKITTEGTKFNLSGLETQVLRKIEEDPSEPDRLAYDVMERIAETISAVTKQAAEETGINKVLFAGGVSSSMFLRSELDNRLNSLTFAFGEPRLSADNAVGIGLLGLSAYDAEKAERRAKKGETKDE